MSAPLRLLMLAHNHPAHQPGGTEALALGLFRTLRARHGVEGVFLAAVTRHHREPKPGTILQAAGTAPDEWLIQLDHFDRFFLAQADTYGLADALPGLVDRIRPDVIHLHHPLFLGVETLDLLRRAAPGAALVVTLHDYFALCPLEGQMRTAEGRLCERPSPAACRRCLPDRAAMDFVLRDLDLRGAFARADALVSPSRFLRDRFAAAGWDASRIELVPNGVPAGPAAPARQARRRDRFAVFGNVGRAKGTLVALRASARLSAAGVAHRLEIHGDALHATEAFRAEFASALAEAPDAVLRGGYRPAEQAARMAGCDWVVVPSVWWENAPLVIQEAFRHRRPVICGGIGGMAEMVRDGADGLHAPVDDPAALADTMRRATTVTGLWRRLRDGIRPPRDLEMVATDHLALYRRLLGARLPARRAA